MSLSSHAVLKEDSLSNSLKILRQELTTYHDEYSARQAAMRQAGQNVFKTLIETMQSSNQNALMLYSQKDGYVFDLTYACHEAIEQYKDFKNNLIPFTNFVDKSNAEVARFDSLIQTLKGMPIIMLDEQAKVDRNVCLALAVNTRRMVVEDRDQLSEYITYYKMTEKRLKNLNDYANAKYKDIQDGIFVNGGDSYFNIISRFGTYLTETKESIFDKYSAYEGVRSQWDSRWIIGLFMAIVIYGLIAIILNQIIVRWLLSHLLKKGKFASIKQVFEQKKTCIILASTAVTFAVILGFVQALSKQNFISMASTLLVQFAWLLSVIIISTLLRVHYKKTIPTLYIYLPLLVNGFLVISFRVVLIPNALVNLIFPPILLLCCIWQSQAIRKVRKMKFDVMKEVPVKPQTEEEEEQSDEDDNIISDEEIAAIEGKTAPEETKKPVLTKQESITEGIDKIDLAYAYISQLVFVVSLVCSAIGYTLLSVQILIWWIMQLTCILTITCIRDWYNGRSLKKNLANKPIGEKWHHEIIEKICLPTAAVLSIVISLYWAADVFNLSDLTWNLFTTNFIDTEDFKASIVSIAQVANLAFIANYLNSTAKSVIQRWLIQHDPSKEKKTAKQRFMMFKNVLQILIWGIWFLVSMAMFHMSNTWLMVISGGLSTGIGFASKDILENIYYGISLMMGRIKIGDLIICDGVRGTVRSISYTSTLIEAVDGSVIAFQNSQLFTKNYKNMTKNHGYEMHILDVGVAYGTNVAKAKQVITNAIANIKCDTERPQFDPEKPATVVLKELGDSALILKVVVWVDVAKQYGLDGVVLEAIYNALNEQNIEIPFPQTDLHIKDSVAFQQTVKSIGQQSL